MVGSAVILLSGFDHDEPDLAVEDGTTSLPDVRSSRFISSEASVPHRDTHAPAADGSKPDAVRAEGQE